MSRVLVVSDPLDLDENEKPKVDPSDPRIRKLVYSMYRDMLNNRNNEANAIISQMDPSCVKQDLGVVPILESIIRQGSGGNTTISTAPPPAPPPPPASSNGTTTGIPPPPPMIGSLPAVRLNTEIGPLNKGPPKQIQGAMMKDKKPFTYTPGGIDLSEIRSPRMAKRIQMNAASEGVTSVPTTQIHPNANGNPNTQHHHLPPAALAAMQPQLPVSVFPQGGFSPANLNRTPKPSDFISQQNLPSQPLCRPPPSSNPPAQYTSIPPPPPTPPPVRFNIPTAQELRQGLCPTEPSFRPSSPASATPMSLASVMHQSIRPQTEVETDSPMPVSSPHQTKAQAVSQQIGSIYIPPPQIEQRGAGGSGMTAAGDRSQPPQTNTSVTPMKKSPNNIDSDSDRDGGINSKTSSASSTPQLNKAPTPWLNSHNKVQTQSPPYVNQSSPWGPSLGRTIPISIMRDEDDGSKFNAQRQQQYQPPNGATTTFPTQVHMTSKGPQTPEHYQQTITIPVSAPGTRVIPIHIQAQHVQGPNQQQRMSYSSPKGLFTSNQQQSSKNPSSSLNEQLNSMSISQNDGYRMDPTQSKSFKVIQRITDDAEEKAQEQPKEPKSDEDNKLMEGVKIKVDEPSLHHHQTEPRFRGGHIPSRTFQVLRSNLPPSPDAKEEHPVFPTRSGPTTHNIQIRMAPQSPTPTFQQYQYVTPMDSQNQGKIISQAPSSSQQQQLPEPKKYTGSNIPSRSFKVLQALNPSDDPGSALEESGQSFAGNPQNGSHYQNPQFLCHPPDPSSYYQNNPNVSYSSQSDNSENESDTENYNNHQQDPNWDEYWYYYWYWANYWNSLGYECPPEGWEAYCQTPTTELETPISIPSKRFKNLQKIYDQDGGSEVESETDKERPCCDNRNKIEKAENEPESLNNCKKNKDCAVPSEIKTYETVKLGSITEDEEKEDDTEEDDEKTAEEEESETEEEFEVKKPPASTNSEEGETVGIVEEPSDDEVFEPPSPRVLIEECEEPEPYSVHHSQSHRADRLSTIDELSETERGLSPLTSSLDEGTDSDDSSSDHDSSTSVIENRSADTFEDGGTTTAKDESASDLSSEEEEDDEEPEVEVQSTVTVRLPKTLSFTKSKSYRDIATVLVGVNSIDSDDEKEEIESKKSEKEENLNTLETKDEADISYTITLSSSNLAQSPDPDQDSSVTETAEDVTKDDPPVEEIDFWGEIMASRKEKKESVSTKKENEDGVFNFWDKPKVNLPKLNLFERHGQFELAQEFSEEQKRASPPTTSPIQEEDFFNQSEVEYEDVKDEEVESSPYIQSECTTAQLSASDETSDESSSKSSTATVTGTRKSSPLDQQLENIKAHLENVVENEKHAEDEKELDNTLKEEESTLQKSCSCHIIDRVVKTENLLWRIERFLKNSFTSVGSEEDSGVMTDQSRQMSDAETDNDEGLPSDSTEKVESEKPESPNSIEQQKKALNYQRAKTHSRLFELLQEECDKEEKGGILEVSEETKDYSSSPLTETAKSHQSSKRPLPSGSDSGLLSFDSSGSLSGSSGLLSPINRDQLLVDLIQQFQSRHKKEIKSLNPGSVAAFPSKIFKLLQNEFGEEFYDAFTFNEDDIAELSGNLQDCAIHKSESTTSINSKSTANRIKKEENGCAENENGDHHLLKVPFGRGKKSINVQPS